MASLPEGNSVIAPAQSAEFAKEGRAIRKGCKHGGERETAAGAALSSAGLSKSQLAGIRDGMRALE
jgi:hypothetical protein